MSEHFSEVTVWHDCPVTGMRECWSAGSCEMCRWSRPLNEFGHDWVSITICVWRGDVDPDSLRLHIKERNTTLYGGKPWSGTNSVPLRYARFGQNLYMNLFTEHVMEYARLLEAA